MPDTCPSTEAVECAANVIPKQPEIVVSPPIDPVQAPAELAATGHSFDAASLILLLPLVIGMVGLTYLAVMHYRDAKRARARR